MKIEREQFLGAAPHERTEERKGYANGYKPKTLQTRLGPLELEVPQVRGLGFYPHSLEKGTRSEKALKVAVAQMYLEGVSTRRVQDITEKLCGYEVSSTQVSRVTKELDEQFEQFRTRQIGEIHYLVLDATYTHQNLKNHYIARKFLEKALLINFDNRYVKVFFKLR